jgi:hypothetical protein
MPASPAGKGHSPSRQPTGADDHFRPSRKESESMFGFKKRAPTRPFTHADNCTILKADPAVQIQWSEVETGHWRAVCQCGSEDVYEEPDRRVRLDPYDPSTFRHAGQCEHRYTSDPALLRAILKVRDGAGGG